MVLQSERITEEGIEDLRGRVGSYFRVQYSNRELTKEAIRHFVEGIGDRNPLFVDEEYARKTRWGGIIAPPLFFHAVIQPSGMRTGGMPGVHAFHSGTDWEFYDVARVGDRLWGTYQPINIVEKSSQFGGISVIVYAEIKYYNQRDVLLARAIGWTIRTERQTAQERGKYSGIKTHRYTEEELETIITAYAAEEVRGAKPRYWEDVREGDPVGPVVKGPLTVGDMIGWSSAGAGGSAHALRVKELRRHPGFSFRDSKTGALQRISQVHESAEVAASAGVPGAYDIGSQRHTWIGSLLTNWMGDDGFLKKNYAEYRRFNIYGDTQFLKGKVAKKYMENGEHLVDLDVWAENQRGEVTTPGTATIRLPSKTAGSSQAGSAPSAKRVS